MSDANSYWYCPTCDEKLDGEAVTFEELHDPKYGGCGFKVESRSRTPNRPPSCDLPPEFYQPKMKPCPLCGAEAERSPCNKSVFRCSDGHCLIYGPWGDSRGKKWNSIPRRSEVKELLRLVDEACMSGQTTVDMARTQRELRGCARKLRKEWNL